MGAVTPENAILASTGVLGALLSQGDYLDTVKSSRQAIVKELLAGWREKGWGALERSFFLIAAGSIMFHAGRSVSSCLGVFPLCRAGARDLLP